MINIADRVFDLLDQHIEDCLSVDPAEDALIDTYWEWWETLKKRVGTSSNFTGVSEYLFFRYILRRIEQRTNSHFKVERRKDTYVFRSDCFLLTHDIDVVEFVAAAGVTHQRTDIAIFSPLRNGKGQLLAAFELKVYVSDARLLAKTFDRLDNLAQHTDAFLFLILFNKQYDDELDKFCAKHPQRAFIIRKAAHAHRYKIGINQAIEKILSAA